MARAGAPKRRSTVPLRKVEGNRIVGRVLVGVGLLTAVVFAVQGGEYGTTDLIKQRRAIALERERVDSLERSVAELDRQKELVESDPATQERIAREEFGMVRGDRELLYRFTEPAAPDSARTP
jgi:cell division protein FtsB